jgi:hypothetical protein
MDSDDDLRGASDAEIIYISSDGESGGVGGGGYGSGGEEESDCSRDDYEVREEVDSMREKVSAIAAPACSVHSWILVPWGPGPSRCWAEPRWLDAAASWIADGENFRGGLFLGCLLLKESCGSVVLMFVGPGAGGRGIRALYSVSCGRWTMCELV